MSYDLWLEVDTGGPEPGEVWDGWNYTSNVAPMWRKAMPSTDGLAGMHGMLAAEALDALTAGIERMEADPSPFEAMNPDDKWGDFESQLECLKELAQGMRAHPKATVRVSR